MSSWDRARFIPWSRIPQDGSDLENKKEKIFREMQREALEAQRQEGTDATNNDGAAAAVTPSGTTTTKQQQQSSNGGEVVGVPFSSVEAAKQFAFGACIGTITGSVFGFMESMKTAQESAVLQKASNAAKGRYLMQGTARSASVLGVFFGGFHVAKYGVLVAVDPGEWQEIGLAGAVSLAALYARPSLRPSMSHAAMLIGMDAFQLVMKET